MEQKLFAEIAASEQKYRNLVENSLVGVLSTTTDGEILYVNEGIMRLLEFDTREELISLGAVVRYKYPEQREEMVRILKRDGSISGFEAVILTKNGSEKTFFFNLTLDGDRIDGVLVDITLLKLTQKALNDSSKRFEAIIEHAPDGIVLLNADGNFSYVSPSARRIFGYTAEEVIAGNPAEFTHPDDLPMVLGELSGLFGDPSRVPVLQYRFAHRTGHWIWVESIFSNLLAEESVRSIVINFRDITKRKKYEDELRMSEDRFRMIFENSGEAILSTETDGVISSANREAERLFGRTEAELKRIGRAGIMDNKDPRLSIALETRQRTGIFKGELNLIKADGSIIPGELTSRVFKDSEGNERTSMIIRDISERKQIEDKIIAKGIELERINAEKDKLFSIIAHDLRNPFNSLLGFTEMLAGGVEDFTLAEIQNIASRMHNSAGNLFKLLENLLNWSSIQRGMVEFTLAMHDLKEIVSQIILLFTLQAESKKVKIVSMIPAGLIVYVDLQMLSLVLRNLLSNAIKFSNPGGTVTLGVNSDETGCVEVYIRDEGIGIPETLMESLFSIGTTTARQGTDGEPSTGLGLVLCKEYIEKHHGTIRVESEPGKGSTFCFTLPFRQD